MFRYVIVLLLINTYSCLGLPVKNNSVSIAASLQLLATQCGNKFISKNILENLSYCNESMKLHSKKEIMCLMFYDINRQLCESNLNTDLNDDTSIKITEAQERKSLCDAAQTWTFGNIQEFPEYAPVAKTIFKNQEKCIGACAVVDDIVSDDSNYHCKYFKWGMDMLKGQNMKEDPKINDIQPNLKPTNNSITSTTINNVSKDVHEENNDKIITSTSNITSASSPVSGADVAQKPEDIPPIPVAKPDVTSNKNDLKEAQEEPPNKMLIEEEINDSIDKAKIERPLSDEKKEVIEDTKIKQQSADADEDQEDDDEHDEDGLSDAIGANDPDGDDQSFNSDPKIDLDKTKNNEKRIEAITSFNGDISQREIFPNTIQDTFSEDDDHFFPFFMTAIIVVVFLYILYHNKNKFTKVILGLIVEGRQSGRRRNSRGHAYRRLDTLEQAMSTNTTAPPSKIIY